MRFGVKKPSLKFRLSKTMKTHIAVLLLTGLFVAVSPRVSAAEEALSVRLRDGRVQEHVNGSLRRSYGNNVKGVSVSGGKVFAQLENGRTAEYENGSLKRTF